MGQGRRDQPGGIPGLLAILGDTEKREAVEYDLIRLGLRLEWLGTPALSWRDLLVIIHQAMVIRSQESAIWHAMVPKADDPIWSTPQEGPPRIDPSRWGLDQHLMAALVDGIRALIWQKTEDGHKGRNAPEPWPRPGLTAGSSASSGSAVPIDEMEAWLAKRNPAQHHAA